jgi:hypothetical protein
MSEDQRISLEDYVAKGAFAVHAAFMQQGFTAEEAFELTKVCVGQRYGFFLGQAERETMARIAMEQAEGQRHQSRLHLPRQ